jgi:hypothetical protein
VDTVYASAMMNMLTLAHDNLNTNRYPADALQDIVDGIYDTWKDSLTDLAHTHLIQYDAEKIKVNPDLSSIKFTNSNTDIIRRFKRAQRGAAGSLLFKARSDAPVSTEAHAHYEQIYGKVEQGHLDLLFTVPAMDNDPHRFKITADMVQQTILEYPRCKSGGPDGLHTQLYRCLLQSSTFGTMFATLLDMFYLVGVTPSDWNVSKLHLLMKDAQTPYIDKSRPIALTNIARRIFERILLRSWGTYCPEWTKFHPCQAGFRSGFSTTLQVCTADELTRQHHPYSGFLDLKAAYDTVPYAQLMDILWKRGCSSRDLSLIYSLMMNGCSSTLVVNRVELATPIMRKRGLFQGSIISPFLFNCFIDALGRKANEGMQVPKLLLFADDICIKAKSRSEAQTLIDCCYEWATTNLMAFGLDKCGSISPDDNQGKNASYMQNHVTTSSLSTTIGSSITPKFKLGESVILLLILTHT